MLTETFELTTKDEGGGYYGVLNEAVPSSSVSNVYFCSALFNAGHAVCVQLCLLSLKISEHAKKTWKLQNLG